MPPASYAEYRHPACAPQHPSGYRGQSVPLYESCAGATPAQARSRRGDDETHAGGAARWRARSRTLSPEPLSGGPGADWSWDAPLRPSSPPGVTGKAHDGRYEGTCRQWSARPSSPSPRYETSRDSSPPSSAGRRSGWEQPAPMPPWCSSARNVRVSRSPSPPRRSRSPRPAAAYDAYEAQRMGVRPPLRSAAVNELLAPLTAPRQREMYPAASVHISREMPMLRHGRVARYVPSKRYGFIVDALDPSAPDLFVNSASLALGCREAHTLIVGAYVMFRSDSRLVNGVMKQYAYDVALADASVVHRGADASAGGRAAQHRSPENAPPHLRGGGRPCAPRR